jgi:hypothetical protein
MCTAKRIREIAIIVKSVSLFRIVHEAILFAVMSEENHSNKPSPHIADLYPDLNEEELLEAEENLDRYLELALRIFSRVKSNPEEYARFKSLTDKRAQSKMKDKGRPFLDLQNQ